MPSRHFPGSLPGRTALLAILMPATILSAAPPVLRPSDGAPGEGGPIDGTRLEFAQKDAALPDQNEPPQAKEAAPDTEAAAQDGDEPIDLGVSVTLDATDHLAPVDKAWQSAWQRSVQAARQKNWQRSLQHLAPIIGRPNGSAREDAMIRLPDATLRSASLEAARLLLKLPQDVRDERSRKLESAGDAALKRALEQRDLRELERVAVHFAGTPAGDSAADRLIALLVDRGHFGLASAWSTLLSDADAPLSRNERWQRREELVAEVLSRSEHRRPGHRAAGNDNADSPARQLARVLTPDVPETLAEWSIIGGNPRRHAVAPAGTPTLVKRWSSFSTSDPQLVTRIDRMIEDLTYDVRSSVPVGVPLFINGRIALRTLRGIEVRDVQSGRLLWTAGERRSLETLLGGTEPGEAGVGYDHFENGLFAVNELNQEFEAADPTGGALGQALFQNATYGFLSSDGQLLFAISDDPVYALGRTSVRNRNGRDISPEPGSASANQLEAFDLETGHLQWRLGGPETGEPASAPLSGWFFLGAPLATNDGLFVVAQNSETIRLFCLEGETGRVRWSQRIGWSDDRLDRDLNRRLWAALPSLAHGVLVCPTSAGWVVGVDSLTGTLLWAHRFSTRSPESGNGTPGLFLRNRGMLEVANRRVDSHWVAAPPVIAGTSVLLTPPETKDANDPSTGIIVCLDLFSGRKLWELPRRDANQLAVVTDRVAVLASSRTLDALQLDGRPAWEFTLPAESGQISGRILATADTLFVPTQSGGVLAVDLENGELRQRWSASDSQRPPGSLYSYDGLLVSVHPAELTAFELQSTLEQKLREGSQTQSLQLSIQRAQLALARGNAQDARQALQSQRVKPADAETRAAFDETVMTTATRLRETEAAQAIEFLAATPQLSDSITISSQRAALEVQLLLQSGRQLEAFRKLIEIARSEHFDLQMLRRPDDPRLEVSLACWLRSALVDAWQTLSAGDRQLADADVRRWLTDSEGSRSGSSDSATAVAADRLANILAFHPTGQALLARQARQAEQSGRASDAIVWWSAVQQAADGPALKTEAQLRLALHTFPLLTELDRDWQLEFLQTRIAADGLSESDPHRGLFDAVERLHRDLTRQTRSARNQTQPATQQPATRQSEADSEAEPSSPRMTIDLQRLPGGDLETRTQLLTNEAGESVIGPRFSALLTSHDYEADRLTVVDHLENRRSWSVPIGSAASPSTPLVARRVGAVLLTMQNRRVCCLSVADRRVLWSLTLNADPWRHSAGNRRPGPLLSGEEWINQLEERDSVLVPSSSGHSFCCRTEREFLVFETLTGRLCWRRKSLHAAQNTVIDGDTVVVLDTHGKPVTGYRLTDGRPVNAAAASQATLPVLRRDFRGAVTVARTGNEITVRRSSHQKVLWEHRFPTDAAFQKVGDTTLAVLKSRGHFETLDLRTGQLADYPRIPARHRIGKTQVMILPDRERWLLLFQGDQLTRPSLGSLQSINAQGTLVSFARNEVDAEPWFCDTGELGLPLDELPRLPFLILLRESRSPLVPLAKTRHLTLLDRRTGTPAISSSGKPIDDLTMPGDTNFSSLRLPHNGAYVELQSGTERLRLTVQKDH